MGAPGREPEHGPVTIDDLRRWSDGGAIWRPLEVSDNRVVIDLCTCSGEPMDRVEGNAPELIAYVRAHRED
jgi:hypothetical protein